MNDKIGCRIEELRKARQWTQAELAKRLQSDKRTLYHWIVGDTSPSLHNIDQLATLFSVSTDYIMGRSNHNAIVLDSLPEQEIKRLIATLQTYLSYTDSSK